MKKTLYILRVVLLAIGFAACGAPTATTTPSFSASAVPAVVTFADPVLEAMVRASLGRSEGDITQAEAQAVTRMDFSNVWSQYLPDQAELIHDLGGLEAFTNLESLDLSDQAIIDISALQGLTKLTYLSLAGNPVSDVTPLAGLTNLKLLILTGSQAQDYNALASLVNLQVLLLDNSTITDLTPLAGLANLQQLYLTNTPTEDYTSLEIIYPNLKKKDFIIPSTLIDLGFGMDSNNHEAHFDSEEATFTINHEAWGMPSREDNQNIIRMSIYLNGEYKASIGYYGVHKVYVCQMDKEGQLQVNYIYNPTDGSFSINAEDRPNAEQMIREAMDVTEGEDVLLAPIRFYNDAIKNTFHMTPEKLFTLPYEPPTLKSLGFVPDETPGIFMYEQHEGIYTNIRIDHNEKENKEYDVVFFQPITDVYRVNLSYHTTDNKLFVGADDNYNGGASFYYYLDTGEHIDEWCSDPDKTVEEYFINAYNDPGIEDIYLHSVELMEQYIRDTFGMTIEELYALPTGE